MKRLGEMLPSVFGGIFIAFTFWGIFWSFHRHGPIHGAASVIFFPYALYRGVASAWEQPAWREEYDQASENLAQLVLANTKDDLMRQVAVTELTSSLRRYLKGLPTAEALKLRANTDKLAQAFDVQSTAMVAAITGRPFRESLARELQEAEAGFVANRSFAKVWFRYKEDNGKPFLKLLAAGTPEFERLQRDPVLAKQFTASLDATMEQAKADMARRIEDVFGESK